jgi:hypothetical protein
MIAIKIGGFEFLMYHADRTSPFNFGCAGTNVALRGNDGCSKHRQASQTCHLVPRTKAFVEAVRIPTSLDHQLGINNRAVRIAPFRMEFPVLSPNIGESYL